MKNKNSFIFFCLTVVLFASLSLTRCGSGIGPIVTSDASGMKY